MAGFLCFWHIASNAHKPRNSEKSLQEPFAQTSRANPQKKFVGLELIAKEPAAHGDCVHVGRAQIGLVTSACFSTILNKNIALCRIDPQYSDISTEVEVGKIDGHQKRITAKVVRFPFYDPDKKKVRS